MAHDDDREPDLREVVAEPAAREEVEVVRRLVEECDVGLRQEEPREGHAHLPAAGELLARPRPVARPETETGEHAPDELVGLLPSRELERRARVLVAVDRFVAAALQRRFGRRQCLRGVEQPRHPGARLVPHAPLGARDDVLGKRRDADARPALDPPFVERELARHHPEERGLPEPLRPTTPSLSPARTWTSASEKISSPPRLAVARSRRITARRRRTGCSAPRRTRAPSGARRRSSRPPSSPGAPCRSGTAR